MTDSFLSIIFMKFIKKLKISLTLLKNSFILNMIRLAMANCKEDKKWKLLSHS